MEIKLNNSDVIFILKNEDEVGSFKTLGKRLSPDRMIFAPIQKGNGKEYVWTIPDDMSPFSEADAIEEAAISKELEICRTEVKDQLNDSRLVDAFFTVPDEEKFVFYRIEESGICKIMLAAWGFRYPTLGKNRGPITISHASKINATIRFICEGKKIANRQFFITNPKTRRKNNFTTNDEGDYCFFGLRAGRKILIVDAESQKEFDLIVEKGKEEYIFDVTPEHAEEPVIEEKIEEEPVEEPTPEFMEDDKEDTVEVLSAPMNYSFKFIDDHESLFKEGSVVLKQGELKIEFNFEENNPLIVAEGFFSKDKAINVEFNSPLTDTFSDFSFQLQNDIYNYELIAKKKSCFWNYILDILFGVLLAAITIIWYHLLFS